MGLDLRIVLLLDNQSTFNLCCNRKFTSSVKTALNALNMTSNGGGFRTSEKCKLPVYKFWVWFSKKTITNIICLKNLIKIYRVTYDSEVDTTFVVHRTKFGLPDLVFEMHPCGLHVCYPKKMGEFGFIQTVKDNMKLFNFIGRHEPSILTFTNWHGKDIGDNPQDADLDGNEDLESVIAHPTGNTGVYLAVEGNDIAGVDQDFAVEPIGVDIEEAFEAYVPLEHAEPEDGLGHQDPIEPERLITLPMEQQTVEPTTKMAGTPAKQAVSPKKGMAARNARVKKQLA
jgi:hypothetical protein